MPNRTPRITPSGKPGVTRTGGTPPRPALPAPRSVSGEGEWERITPETRAKVWKKRFGFRSTGTCVCCHQKTIRRDDFACGLRRAYTVGGSNDVSNLEPICASCKEQMGTHDLVSWCRTLHKKIQVVKPMPKTTTGKKTGKKMTAKKPATKAAAVKKAVAKKSVAKKPVKKTLVKKPAAKKAKR
jgi:hypothetical protein